MERNENWGSKLPLFFYFASPYFLKQANSNLENSKLANIISRIPLFLRILVFILLVIISFKNIIAGLVILLLLVVVKWWIQRPCDTAGLKEVQENEMEK
jgi:uncharacterized membrane protein